MDNIFINKTVTKMIGNYLENNEDINVLSCLLDSLFLIYGETDIINTFNLSNEELFYNNLNKYNYSKDKLIKFFNILDDFNELVVNKNTETGLLLYLEKELINMYMLKMDVVKVTEDEFNKFKDSLFLKNSPDSYKLSINYLYIRDVDLESLLTYKTPENYNPESGKHLLSPEAYKVINKDYTVVNVLTKEEIDLINDQVYSALNVNKHAINFDYLFDKAISEFYKEKNKLTSGNRYVDILLIMSVIATLLMSIFTITLLFL